METRRRSTVEKSCRNSYPQLGFEFWSFSFTPRFLNFPRPSAVPVPLFTFTGISKCLRVQSLQTEAKTTRGRPLATPFVCLHENCPPFVLFCGAFSRRWTRNVFETYLSISSSRLKLESRNETEVDGGKVVPKLKSPASPRVSVGF